jgi:hypothetical protein
MHCGCILILIGMMLLPPPAQSEHAKRPHLLQAIIFESYLTKQPEDLQFYGAVDLPSNDFPLKFSRLFDPSGKSETLQLPRSVVFPRAPMFLDIHTFEVDGKQIRNKKLFSHRNDLQKIHYKIRFLSWADGRYRAELEGRIESLEFKNIRIEASADKTKIVTIRLSDNRTAYIALTAIETADSAAAGVIPPKPTSRPPPVYPSDLLKTDWSGAVRILAVVTKEGKADRQNVIFLDCPHFLLGRNGLDVVLNEWNFKAATKNGVPLDFATIVEVDFFKPRKENTRRVFVP